jgi:peptidyl-prolyl cis-trans isomerase SurA
MRIFHLLICVLCAAGPASLSQTIKPKKQQVLFSVNKVPTYTDEFIYLYKKNHQNKPGDFTEPKINEYLTLFTNFKLKVAEAKALGLDTTAKFRKEYKTYREDLKKPYRAEPDALEKLTKETYQHLTEEVKASHILINLQPDAFPADTLIAYNKIADIKKRALAGEDFEKLARELSEDPSGKYNGGNLGYFTAMQMVYPFEKEAYLTNKGQLSNIVRTRFGYHLIKVMDRKPARGEVEVSHILLRSGSTDDAKIKNKAFDIFDQLKAGRSWDELCKEHSEDTNTKDSGGRLRAFGVGALASVPEFESTAFALQNPGDISDPFQSSVGWHMVRLEKKIPLPTYSELEASLKKKVARDERLQISQQALITKRRKDFGLTEIEENKKTIFAFADSSLTKGKWKYTGSPELLSKKLFLLVGKEYTAADFVTYVKQNQNTSGMAPAAYIDQLYNFFVDESISIAEEEKLKAEKPEFKNLLTEYKEGILFFEIMEKEVWNKASEDTLGQRKYYQNNLEKYKAGDRIEARLFSTPDKNIIEEFKKKVAAGDTLKSDDLKKFKSVQPFRNYEKGESKVIDKVSWATGMHEVEVDKIFYLVDVARLVAPGIKSFEEARAGIISDYQNELEKNWLATLRKKYPVAINSKGKKLVMADLKKK